MTLFPWQLFVALFFFMLSGMFSATETALVSLSRPRLKKLIAQRPALAGAFSEWLAAPQYLLTTILVGNTLCNVFVALLSVEVAHIWLPDAPERWVETGVWLIMTVVVFIFADFVPKSLARHYPQRISLLSIRVVSTLSRWLTPMLRLLIGFFDKFPMFEGEPVGKLSLYSLEELREVIRAGAEEGQLHPDATLMMENALKLQAIPVSKIMTPFEKIDAVNLGQSPERILDEIAEMGHTRIPAYRVSPRKIGGYLHAKDLLYVWRGVLPLNLDALMRKPLYVDPDYPAAQLLDDFRKGRSHMAVVVNEAGNCLGIATLQDVLDEIIGELLGDAE